MSLSLDLLRWNAVGTSKRRGQVGGHRHHALGEERSRPGKEIWGWSAIWRIFEARRVMEARGLRLEAHRIPLFTAQTEHDESARSQRRTGCEGRRTLSMSYP